MNVPAYRAAARIAWRQARRAPWRSALVVCLVAFPVASLVGAATVIRTAYSTADERMRAEMGSADIEVYSYGTLKAAELLAHLPAGSTLVERRIATSVGVLGGQIHYVNLTELSAPAENPPAAGLFHLLQGRFPTAPGEAALQPQVLDAYGAQIGDRVRLADKGKLIVLITGTVVDPELLDAQIAVLGPGTLPPNAAKSYLVGLPAGVSPSEVAAGLSSLTEVSVTTRQAREVSGPWGKTAATGGSFAATAVALFAAGLIAAAAFVVGARRQLRTLGLISAAGGEPRHVRATVLLGGTVLGFIGSCVGLAIGIAASFAIQPQLHRWARRIVGPVRIPMLPLLGALALGTAASTLAAYGPARSAAKLSTVEELAGRTPPPKAPGRLAAAGLVVAVAGGALVSWATKAHARSSLAVGLIGILSGFLVAIPLVVTWFGRGAGHLPTAPRIAARDLARNGRRTAAALAAATIALAVPVSVGALTLSQDAQYGRVPYMAADQLSIGFFDGLLAPAKGDSERLIGDLRAAFPGSLVVPLRVAAQTQLGKRKLRPILVEGPFVQTQGQATRVTGDLLIGDVDVLRAFHAEEGVPALESGSIVSIGPGGIDKGVVHITKGDGGGPGVPGSYFDLPAVEAGSTSYASLGNGQYVYVISANAAAARGFVITKDSLSNPQIVLRAPRDLSQMDIQRARDVASKYAGASVVSLADLGSHNGPGRWAANAAGAVLALAIVGVVVGLLGAESRKDRAILAAVGASPRTRRSLAGASAWVVAAVAGILAVPVGFVPVVVFRIAQARDYPIIVPWTAIAVAALVVPLVAGGAAALGSREPKPMSLLRPIT